jgi:hypothetical protein
MPACRVFSMFAGRSFILLSFRSFLWKTKYS